MASLLIISRLDVQYGVPVAAVLEIADLHELMPLHDPIAGCVGSTSHRGYLVPVFDPCSLGTERRGALSPRLVILRVGGRVFGLLLDAFVRIATLEGGDDGAVPSGNPYAARIIAYGDGALVLLSVEAIAELVGRHFARQRFPGGTDEPERAARDATEGGAEIYVSARIESTRFAMPVEHVTEIVEGNDVTPLFNVPPLLRGLINLRGRVLACLDISGELGFPPRPLGERNQFVILGWEGEELALWVDEVTGIRRFSPTDFQRSEPVLGGELGRLAGAIHEGEDGTLLILAVPAVFDAPALAPLRGIEA